MLMWKIQFELIIWYLVAIKPSVFAKVNVRADEFRDGKGFEDTGFGICHTHGMLPTNKSFKYFSIDFDSVQNIELFRDVVKVNEDTEEEFYDSDIYYDDFDYKKKRRLLSPGRNVEVTVYWSRLIARAYCVDRLNITLGSKIDKIIHDPADSEVT